VCYFKKISGPDKNPVPGPCSQRRKLPPKASFRDPHFQDRQPFQSGPATGFVSPKFRNRAQIGLLSGSATPLFGAKLLVDLHEHRVRQIITILHRPGHAIPGHPRSRRTLTSSVEDLKVFSCFGSDALSILLFMVLMNRSDTENRVKSPVCQKGHFWKST